jgi:hypothetical protein
METNPIYATAGGIRTYPHLLEGRNKVYMHYMFILNYTRLYMCFWMEGREWIHGPCKKEWCHLNRLERPILSWNRHLAKLLKERV